MIERAKNESGNRNFDVFLFIVRGLSAIMAHFFYRKPPPPPPPQQHPFFGILAYRRCESNLLCPDLARYQLAVDLYTSHLRQNSDLEN